MSSEVKHEYIDYLERVQNTLNYQGKSLLEIHQEVAIKEVAKAYGVTDDEYNTLTGEFAKLQSA